MKLIPILAAAALAFGTVPSLASEAAEAVPDRETAEADCKRWAAETGVAEEERKAYIEDCVRELLYPDKPEKGEEGGGGG